MSILSRRWILNAIIASSFLMPLISYSQVRIKEKVELKPLVKLSSNAAVELTITFHWTAKLSDQGNHLMHLQVIDPGSHSSGFDPNTGSTSGNYTEVITDVGEANYSGESTYSNSSPLSGYYYLYAIHDVHTWWINYWRYYYIEVKAPGIIDTTIYLENPGWSMMYELPYVVNGVTCGFWGSPSEPCSGANFQIGDITDVQHGEQKYIRVSIVDDCGAIVGAPPEYFYKYELLGDAAKWGFLRDPMTGRTGAILDSVNSTNIEFDAWGKDTDSVRVLSIRVSAENGSITPATAAFTLLPPEVRVLAGKTTLAFGDTTLLTMQVRYPNGAWMERPNDWRSWFAIAQTDTFGHIYTPDSSDYGESIYGYNPAVIYYARPQAAADSDEVLIVLSASEPSSGDTGIRVPVYRDKSTVSQKPGKGVSQPNSSTAAKKKKGDAISVRDNASSHYGLVRLKLGRNTLKILDHSPWAIWPFLPPQISTSGRKESRGADLPGYDPKRSFRVLVKDPTGQPVTNEEVEVVTEFDTRSGGHKHDYGLLELPQPRQGLFYGQNMGKNPIRVRTDMNGMAVVDSLVGLQVSGKYLVTARLVADTTVKDTVNLQIKVPGLVNFRDLIVLQDLPYTYAQSDTGEANHPDNDWCFAEMGNNLFLGILDFYEWAQSDEGEGSPIKTSINDMSLPWGGYFDVGAKWNTDKPSHSFHRVGFSVDINNTGFTKKIENPDPDPKARAKRPKVTILTPRGLNFIKFMNAHHGNKYPEDQIHFGFNNSF